MDLDLHDMLPKAGQDAVLSYSGVVKRWECDRNNHWNIQFYTRAFQMASEVLAVALTGSNPGAASTRMRHFRFHRELFCPESMRIRSSRIIGGEWDGMVLHWMETGPDDQLCATAIEVPTYPTIALPGRTCADIMRAFPRGISAGPHEWTSAGDRPNHSAQLGMVRPGDVDHTGDITANELASRVAAASHHLLGRIGFTSDWIDRTNCNRMAVEMKITRHGPCRAGDSLSAISWLSARRGTRAFSTTHQIVNEATRTPCATFEQLMLIIDLDARKPVRLPEFILQAGTEAVLPMESSDGLA